MVMVQEKDWLGLRFWVGLGSRGYNLGLGSQGLDLDLGLGLKRRGRNANWIELGHIWI